MTQPNNPNPYGGQQLQQPQPNQQWAGQPQWGAQQQPRQPKSHPAWPTWFMLGFFLLSFLTSFLAVGRIKAGFEGFASINGSLNWWGAVSAKGTGLGALIQDEVKDAVGGGSFLLGLSTVVVLGCYIAATVLLFLSKEKLGAILGVVASGFQALAILIFFIRIVGEATASFGAGWWFWFLNVLVALPFCIFLLVKGRSTLEQQYSKAKHSMQEAQQRKAAQNFQQQYQQQNFPQPGQPGQPQQFQQPQPPQQPGQPGQWGAPNQDNGPAQN